MNNFDIEKYLVLLENSTSAADCPTVPLPEIGADEEFLFISYSHQDYKAVYRDLAVMYAAGVRFWYDRGLAAGANWDDEVEGIMKKSGCCGIIFYMSENLFQSASANKEIRYALKSGGDHCKNYFCVNLTSQLPSGILRRALIKTAMDMDSIAVIANAFSDKQTYLSFSHMNHAEQLIEQIARNFNVITAPGKTLGFIEIPLEARRIPVDREAFYIGRNQRKCHLVIGETYVSSLHAAIYMSGNNFVLNDMNSTNGTYLNGKRLSSAEHPVLKDGDMITLGQKTVIFRLF